MPTLPICSSTLTRCSMKPVSRRSFDSPAQFALGQEVAAGPFGGLGRCGCACYEANAEPEQAVAVLHSSPLGFARCAELVFILFL